MATSLKIAQNKGTHGLLALLAMLHLVACGSKDGPGPKPKPPWPDSPAPSFNRVRNTPTENTPFKIPGNLKSDVAIIALSDVWVLVKPEGKNEIWKNLREGERLVIPKTGPMAITYSSGKNLQTEAGVRVIKPAGGSEGVGFLGLE